MRGIPKRLMFIVCVIAVVLIHRMDIPLLFGFAALVAFVNLLSSQFGCVLDGCSSRQSARSLRDPAYVASLVNRITAAVGAILLVYALINI
ncbi:MAG: hypothetical protein RPU64_10935 [Candidatus Sedimenticola sp. (ex Thyasira tokunagai)]